MKLTELKKLEGNPRTISKEDMERLKESIKKFGVIEGRPFLVSNRTGENIIIGGNQRYEACKALGIKDVPVHIMEGLTEEQEREIIIRDNVSNGDWDMDILANEWEVEDLKDWGVDINFETVEPTAEEDDFEVDEGIQTDIVLGDLFEIGPHRLICGDSTNIDDVNKLMNGDKADMVFTDPPYGIKIVGGKGKVGGDNKAKNGVYSEVIGDDTTDTAMEFYNTCIALGMDDFIIWGGNYFTDFLPFSSSWIIWDKRGDMNSNNFADGEMAWCSFQTRVRIYKQIWNGMIREGEKDKRVHPTQKPVNMLGEIIKDHIVGNIIYDGFGGSGSTMVACHQLNRKCYMSELDPKYVQTIVNRMQKLAPDIEIKRNGILYEKPEISG